MKSTVTIIGAGFTGLSAAYELAKKGISVTVLEADSEIGGLAAAFTVGGQKLDRFYHHWFTNDLAVMNLIDELGLQKSVQINPTNTGVYYANHFFKLSTPFDLLKFTPLNFAQPFSSPNRPVENSTSTGVPWKLFPEKSSQLPLKG